MPTRVGITKRRKDMKTDSDRKNRRVPILSLILLLTSAVLTLVCKILQLTAGSLIHGIITAKEMNLLYGSTWMYVLTFTASNLIYTLLSVTAVSSFTIFIIIAIMQILKAKGGAFAGTSFLAFVITSVKCLIGVVWSCLTLLLPGATVKDSLAGNLQLLVYSPSTLISWITRLLGLVIPLCWLALGIACLFSILFHKAKKKGTKIFACVMTVLFGIGGCSMFIVKICNNILAVISDVIQNVLAFTVKTIAMDPYSWITYHPSYFIGTIFGFIFVFANILGFAGMILLVKYLLNPYKKGKKDAEAVECECTEHTECHCCGEGAECTCHEHTECTCGDEECACAHETTEAEPQASEIADPINA